MPRSLIALVLCAGFGPSAEPPSKAPSPEQLTRQLGAPEFATREQASESLRELGAAALPAVQLATTSDDPETRRRALALLPALQARIAFTPRRVAIDPKPITLAAALDSLRQQTGYVVTADPPAGKELYTFGMPDGTFWEAVDRIAERTNRSVVTTSEDIRLVPGTARSPFTVRDGAFRVTLENIHEDRNIDFSQGAPGKHDHKLVLQLSVLAEPRFAILGGGPAQFAEVVDDRGGKLREAPDEGRTFYFGWDVTGTAHEASVHGLLRRSPKQGTRLATVSGVIPLRVIVERRRTEVVPTGAQGQKFRVGNDVLAIRRADFSLTGDTSINLQVPLGTRETDWRCWHQRVTVEDIWGSLLPRTGCLTDRDGGDYQILWSFGRPSGWFNAPARRIIVEEWIVLEYKVRFTFKDVLLP